MRLDARHRLQGASLLQTITRPTPRHAIGAVEEATGNNNIAAQNQQWSGGAVALGHHAVNRVSSLATTLIA